MNEMFMLISLKFDYFLWGFSIKATCGFMLLKQQRKVLNRTLFKLEKRRYLLHYWSNDILHGMDLFKWRVIFKKRTETFFIKKTVCNWNVLCLQIEQKIRIQGMRYVLSRTEKDYFFSIKLQFWYETGTKNWVNNLYTIIISN